MKLVIVSSRFCQKCNRPVELSDAVLGREQLSSDCKRIFLCCPDCGAEIENEIVPESHLMNDQRTGVVE